MASIDHVARHDILAFLSRVGSATPNEIAAEIGWPEAKQAQLRQLLGRMTKSHMLVKEGYGKYRLPRANPDRGTLRADVTPEEILKFVEDEGGFASKADILEFATGVRKSSLSYWPHVQATNALSALKDQGLLASNFKRGLWNVPHVGRGKLIMAGRWAGHELALTVHGKAEWEAAKEAHFLVVGEAFSAARGDLSLRDVVDHSPIRDCLQEVALRHQGARSKAVSCLRASVVASHRDGPLTPLKLVRMLDARIAAELPHQMYGSFESGTFEVHCAMPAKFYRAAADLFGVDAQMLSRGEVLPLAVPKRPQPVRSL